MKILGRSSHIKKLNLDFNYFIGDIICELTLDLKKETFLKNFNSEHLLSSHSHHDDHFHLIL